MFEGCCIKVFSRKQEPALSSAEAELCAMTENSKELVLLDMLLESILDGISLTISGTPAVYNMDLPAHSWTVNIWYWTVVLLHDVRA